jgi:sugar phosphate isomerase/epimerase
LSINVYGVNPVKFGVCCSPEKSSEFAALGFDFVEWSVASNVGTVGEDRITELQEIAVALPVRPEAWNILLPGDLKVVGPEANLDTLRSYLDVALPRVRALGGEVIVFGSGRSRTIPEKFDRQSAVQQFETACQVIADVAAANDLTIVLEPLRTGETNLINTVAEGEALVRRIDHESFALLADLYHMLDNEEPLSSVVRPGVLLKHVHIASRPRFVPLEGDDLADLRAFLVELKRAGYDGRMSFECKTDDIVEFARGLEILRDAWTAA